jgi:LysM repeat protein
MKPIRTLTLALFLLVAAPAQANVPHTVQPGETLWTIAAANNFTTRALAAANGLSEDAQVVLGSTIMIPSQYEAATALGRQAAAAPGQAPAGGHAVQPGETLSGIAAANGVSTEALAAANGLSPTSFAIAGTTLRIPSASAAPGPAPQQPAAPKPLGGYKVRLGESLSAIAAAARVAPEQIAYMNGLDPDGLLLAGTVLKLPTGASAPQSSAPAPAQTVVPQAPPAATPERLDATTIGQIAAQHGVSPSLASAIAWQESGFNNGIVSGANARGVMQMVPGTWDWVNRNLAGANQLNPNSALDNVRGGVLYLRQLLNDFGGDEASAIAAYYQGEGAVRSRGLFDDTKRYVQNVTALRSRFGG